MGRDITTPCLTYEVHGAAILKLAFGNIWNDLQRVPDKVIHRFEPTVLDGSVRNEPTDDEKHEVEMEMEMEVEVEVVFPQP